MLSGALIAPAIAQNEILTPGTVPGDFEVDDQGAATYGIPISIPPGTANLAPKIGLAYSSRAGNGLLGVGWMLTGIPTITRCSKTLEHDTERTDVTWDTNTNDSVDNKDRFCLDGQRLVVISGKYGAGSSPANGNYSEYRTASESFARITYGTHGIAGAPRHFRVATKDGQRLVFGDTEDTQSIAVGPAIAGAPVRAWALSRVEDSIGNRIWFGYAKDAANNQLLPLYIDYAPAEQGVTTLNPATVRNRVQFLYAPRGPGQTFTDLIDTYSSGIRIRTDKLLAGVRTYVDAVPQSGATDGGVASGTLVADYRLTYQASTITGRSQLIKVQVCDKASTGSDATCLQPTTFTWSNGGKGLAKIGELTGGPADYNPTLQGERVMLADVDGDGKADLIVADGAGSTTIYRATGGAPDPNQLFTAGTTITGLDCRNFKGDYDPATQVAPPACFALDMNKDRKADLVVITYTGVGGSSVANVKVHLAYPDPDQPNLIYALTNTAGKPTAVYTASVNMQPARYGRRYFVMNFIETVNNRGRTEFIIRDNNNYSHAGKLWNGLRKFWDGSSGGSFLYRGPSVAAGEWGYDYVERTLSAEETERHFVGDPNGDHIDDIIVRESDGRFRVYVGHPREQDDLWVMSPGGSTATANGVTPLQTPLTVNITSGGTANVPGFSDAMPVKYQRVFPLDTNGDGRTDLVLRDPAGKVYVFLSQAPTSPGGTAFYTYGGELPTQTGFIDDPTDANKVEADDQRWFAFDVNGDGLADLVFPKSDGALEVYLATGRGFERTEIASANIGVVGASSTPAQTGSRFFVTDVDGDGRSDLIRRSPTGEIWVYYARNNTLVQETYTASDAALADRTVESVGERFFLADVTGDGRADLIALQANGTFFIYSPGGLGVGQLPKFSGEAISRFDSGYGVETQVALRPMSWEGMSWAALDSTASCTGTEPDSRPLYTADTTTTIDYPAVRMRDATLLVAATKHPTAAGKDNCATYHYKGAIGEAHALKFVGFREVTTRDVRTRIEEVKTLTVTGTYSGQTEKIEKRYSAGGNTQLLQRSTYAYGSVTTNGSTFIYPTSSVEETYDLTFASAELDQPGASPNGCFLVSKKTTTYSGSGADGGNYGYDAYGNLRVASITAQVFDKSAATTCAQSGYVPGAQADSQTTKTETVYTNDTANWRLGQITRIRTLTTSASGEKRVKRSAFERYNGSDGGPAGFVKSEIIEPELQCSGTGTVQFTWPGTVNVHQSSAFCTSAEFADISYPPVQCTNWAAQDPENPYIVTCTSINWACTQGYWEYDPEGPGRYICTGYAPPSVAFALNGGAYSDNTKVTTTYEYDSFGNRKKATVTARDHTGAWSSRVSETDFGNVSSASRGRFAVSSTKWLNATTSTSGGAPNLVANPEALNANPWINPHNDTVLPDNTTAPNGTMTADRLNIPTPMHPRYQQFGIAKNNNTYVASTFVKPIPGGATDIMFQLFMSGGTHIDSHLHYNLATGALSITGFGAYLVQGYGVIDSHDGWKRIWIATRNDNTANKLRVSLSATSSVGTFWAWGIKAEVGTAAGPTPYDSPSGIPVIAVGTPHTATNAYDPRFGAVTSITDPNNLVMTSSYDGFGRKTEEVRPDGTRTQTGHWLCTPTSGTPNYPSDPDCDSGANPEAYFVETRTLGTGLQEIGPATRAYFDAFGRETRSIVMKSFSTASGSSGGLDPNKKTVAKHTEYYDHGPAKRIAKPYYRNGATNEPQYWSTTAYDWLDRPWKVTTPDGVVTKTTREGRKGTTSTDNATTQTVSGAQSPTSWTITQTVELGVEGRKLRIIDVNGQAATFAYDPLGNLKQTTDTGGSVTTFTYNVRGQRIAISDPNSGNWSFAYTGFGELKSQTDGNGITTTFTYDSFGRQTSRTEAAGTANSKTAYWIYDSASTGPVGEGLPVTAWKGQLVRVEYGTGYTQTRYFDALGRPANHVERIDQMNYTFARSYDAASGRLADLTYPNGGFGLQYEYTALGHLWKVRNKFNTAQVYWEARERDAEGNLRHYMHHRIGGLGNDTHVFREYDSPSSRLTAIKAGFSDGSQTDLQHLTYAYDTIGNMVSRRDEKLNAGVGIKETFGYDKLNRVTSSKLGSDFSAFSYTANGNLDVKDKGLILGGTRKAAKFIYCSATSHRVCSTRDNANQATVQSFTYDGNGNVTQYTHTETNKTIQLTWTPQNLPKRITKNPAGAAIVEEFEYSPDNQRIKQTESLNGTVRHWVWYVTDPQTGALYEVEGRPDQGSMARWKAYLSVGGDTVGMWVNETWSGGASYIHWFLKDHLGSTVAFVGTDGALVQRIGYELWGKKRSGYTWVDDATEQGAAETNSIYGPHDRGFTGHEHLFTGLIHMNGRVYDPILGKFLSPDPVGQMVGNTQGLNRYSYVDNNPLGYTDPTGHWKLLKKIGKFLKAFLKPKNLLTMAVLFVASYYLAPMLSTALLNMNMAAAGVVEGLAAGAAYGNALASANLVAGLATGFVGGALAGAIQGGSLKSAVIGGVFGAIAGGIGAHLGDAAVGSNRWFLRVGLHTAAGGARAQLAGGRFLSGAIGAGVTAGVGGYLHRTFGEGLGPRLGGFVAASTTGGLSAFAASGGKTSAFTNGLISAGFEYAFNTAGPHGGGGEGSIWDDVKSALGEFEAFLERGWEALRDGISNGYQRLLNNPWATIESALNSFPATRVEGEMAKAAGAAAGFIVSSRGIAVEASIAGRWAQGTFGDAVSSIEYHYAKHGGGRTLAQYTDDAASFFEKNRGQAQWGKWNPNWEESFRLKIGGKGGYYTKDGKILTYWD